MLDDWFEDWFNDKRDALGYFIQTDMNERRIGATSGEVEDFGGSIMDDLRSLNGEKQATHEAPLHIATAKGICLENNIHLNPTAGASKCSLASRGTS